VSLTTIESIESDPKRRLSIIESWTELPELITANQGEEGIDKVIEWALSAGVGIEACILSTADAEKFVRSRLRERCRRILLEAMDPNPEVALRDITEMGAILDFHAIKTEQFHHGFDGSCWAVFARALDSGHGLRTGLEDVAVLEDGRLASSNHELVEATVAMARRKGRLP